MARAETLSVYRALLKATRKSFAGDPLFVKAAWKEAHDVFRQYRHVKSEEEIQSRLKRAREFTDRMTKKE